MSFRFGVDALFAAAVAVTIKRFVWFILFVFIVYTIYTGLTMHHKHCPTRYYCY